MARIFLTYIVPFLLPTAAYAGWVWFRAAYAERHGGEPPKLEQGPWPLLLFLGAILALVVLGGAALLRGGDAGSVYTPPRVENGQVVPGRLENRKP